MKKLSSALLLTMPKTGIVVEFTLVKASEVVKILTTTNQYISDVIFSINGMLSNCCGLFAVGQLGNTRLTFFVCSFDFIRIY